MANPTSCIYRLGVQGFEPCRHSDLEFSPGYKPSPRTSADALRRSLGEQLAPYEMGRTMHAIMVAERH